LEGEWGRVFSESGCTPLIVSFHIAPYRLASTSRHHCPFTKLRQRVHPGHGFRGSKAHKPALVKSNRLMQTYAEMNMKIVIIILCALAMVAGCSHRNGDGSGAPDQSSQVSPPVAPTNRISQQQAVSIACKAMGVERPEKFLNVTPPFYSQPRWIVEYAHPLGDNWNVTVDSITGEVIKKGRKA
jgi:hypothetical protein